MGNAPERVLVGNIQKFSLEDGPGIRTTVFFKGCPLNCRWCHNPELIEPGQQLIQTPNNCIGCGYCMEICPAGAVSADPESGIVVDREKCTVCLTCADNCFAKALRPVAKLMTAEEILRAVEQDKGFYDNTGGGMTVSGGEVLMHADFISGLIDGAGRRGINVCVDTCGYGDPQSLMELALKENVTDVLFDMKAVDDEVHREYTGVGNELIIENLRMLASDPETRDKLTMRMPLIRGVNDGEEMIRRTGELFRSIGVKRVNPLPYHNLGISKQRNVGGEMEEFEAPDEDRISEIEEYFRSEIGLDVEIMGRV